MIMLRKNIRLRESSFNKTYFIVQIVKSLANNRPESRSEDLNYHESIRKDKVEPRVIDVDKATFCPRVSACTGRSAPYL